MVLLQIFQLVLLLLDIIMDAVINKLSPALQKR